MNPAAVTRAHVEAFQAWMVETRSAGTALNKRKCLKQFFGWLQLDEEVIDRSPMRRIREPRTPVKLVAVLGDETPRSCWRLAAGRASSRCGTRR